MDISKMAVRKVWGMLSITGGHGIVGRLPSDWSNPPGSRYIFRSLLLRSDHRSTTYLHDLEEFEPHEKLILVEWNRSVVLVSPVRFLIL